MADLLSWPPRIVAPSHKQRTNSPSQPSPTKEAEAVSFMVASLDRLRTSIDAALQQHQYELASRFEGTSLSHQSQTGLSLATTTRRGRTVSAGSVISKQSSSGALDLQADNARNNLPNCVRSLERSKQRERKQASKVLTPGVVKSGSRQVTPSSGCKLDAIKLMQDELRSCWSQLPPRAVAFDWPLSSNEKKECSIRCMLEREARESETYRFLRHAGSGTRHVASLHQLPPDGVPPKLELLDASYTPKSDGALGMADLENGGSDPGVLATSPVRVVSNEYGTGSSSDESDRTDEICSPQTAGRRNAAGAWTKPLAKRKTAKLAIPLSKRKLEVLEADWGWLQIVTRHPMYRISNSTLIILNAILIIWETQHRATCWDKSATLVEIDRDLSYFRVFSSIFCILFVLDLSLRMLSERSEFFSSREKGWNIFDVIVVLTAVAEMFTALWVDRGSAVWTFSMLRVMRLLRIIRTSNSFRLIRFISELRLMVSSLVGSLRSLAWAILLLLIVLMMFGVFFTDGAITYCASYSLDDESTFDLRRYFGTIPVSTLSLYMAMSGGEDWAHIMRSLDVLPPEYGFIFLCYITFAVLALGNVITAVFLESAMQRSHKDREFMVQEEMVRKQEFMSIMQDVFEELDTNNSGALSLEEFEKHIDDEKIIAYLGKLGLEISHVRTLFQLLDADNTGEVDLEEFVSGCLRLRGGAKSLDLAILMYQMEFLVNKLGRQASPAPSVALDQLRSHSAT